jgi:hypothetical protein
LDLVTISVKATGKLSTLFLIIKSLFSEFMTTSVGIFLFFVDTHYVIFSLLIPLSSSGSQRHLTDFPKSWSQCTQLLVEKRSISLLIQWGDYL